MRQPTLRPDLIPMSGVDPAGDGWSTSASSPLYDVAIDATALAGSWTMCEVRVASALKLVRPSLHVRLAGARVVHDVPVDAAGCGRWIGFLPRDLAGLGFEPTDRPGRFRVESFSLRRLSEGEIVRRALAADPIRTARALFWRVARRRLRARYLLRDALAPRAGPRLGRPGRAYDAWIRKHDTFSADELAALGRAVEARPSPPLISVVMPVYDPDPDDLRAAIESVRAQVYPHWELRIADDASTDPAVIRLLDESAASDPRIRLLRRPVNGHISAASNTALEGAAGLFTAFMDHDDLMPAHALLLIAVEIVDHPDADLIYTDEDKIDARGRRCMPHFKPDWNEELLLAQNYINHLAVFRTAILRRIGGFRLGLEGSQDHDLILRFVSHTSDARIRHIPRILYHWRNHRTSRSFSERSADRTEQARRRALADHVERQGWDADVVPGAMGANRLRRRLADPPEVTVIIPTRDAARLTGMAARGVLSGTDYLRLKLIVVDNGSVEPETAALFAELRRDGRVTILHRPGPFNFSALNNDAVAHAAGEVICFLNNDIEVIEPGWLTEMVSGLIGDVAAVGAKLLYPDRTVQHAGVILGGGGVASHAHPDRAGDSWGYFGRAMLPQHLSAVTAACMVVRRRAFEEVGGFDAAHLMVAFNDIDLCLKLRERGYKILFDPYAVLVHHESATRGLDRAPEKQARFQREVDVMLDRWGSMLRRDPYYNPNLALDEADFRLLGVDRPRRRPRRTSTPSP